ncbi:alpha/beta fold hydrolase [Pontibacter chinhatensis]|uniref:Pimeloyl-ACP methyl ester carboxylesterase n=1 Tax=Pontibacter chinhatensis TaxID=1436961 RepID=A0A1I2M4V9_9BACT|nr:alpha/beta hydrolase [Pontibacter chinhatensis]SFF85908.1 Pimeloyl-ACP methyl ester carboxylesterase [Pontibacter chinhatensis]
MTFSPILTKEEFILVDDAELCLKWVYPKAATDSKPVLVFLHDSLGCIKLWRDIPEKLAQATGCTALIYDRQGYGQSSPFESINRGLDYLEQEADVLERLLEKLQISQAILIGHSDGGSIALMAAAKYKSRIKAIITEGAHVFVEEETLAGIRAAVEAYQTTDLPQKLQKYHGAKTEAVFPAWTDTWLSSDFRSWNIEHFLPSILCPALIIQGEKDEYGTLAQVEAVVQQAQGPVQQLILPGIAHTPHREAPELVLEKSAQFILSSQGCV